MTSLPDADLGWSAPFLSQLSLDETATALPARIAAVHRDAAQAITRAGPRRLTLPPGLTTGEIAVGDWVLADPETLRITRVLDRQSLLKRRAPGTGRPRS